MYVYCFTGFNTGIASVIIAICVALYTVAGGVGGTLYVSYFACIIFMSIIMYFMTYVFWDLQHDPNNKFGNITMLYNKMGCVTLDADNQSPLTFTSHDGVIEAILLVLCKNTLFSLKPIYSGCVEYTV